MGSRDGAAGVTGQTEGQRSNARAGREGGWERGRGEGKKGRWVSKSGKAILRSINTLVKFEYRRLSDNSVFVYCVREWSCV